MKKAHEEEIWLFDAQCFVFGISLFTIYLLVLGLSVQGFKVYAYSAAFLYIGMILYVFILKYRKIKQALKWDKVLGTVIESQKISKLCFGSRRGRIYSIELEYKYIIDEEKIYSNSWSLFKCEEGYYSSEEISKMLRTVRPRSEVDVFVNPENKYEAYINKDELLKLGLSYIEDMLLLLFSILGTLIFIVYFT